MACFNHLPRELKHIIFSHFLSSHSQINLAKLETSHTPYGGLCSALFHINRHLRREALAYFFLQNQVDYGIWDPLRNRIKDLPRLPWDSYVVHLRLELLLTVEKFGDQYLGFRPLHKSYETIFKIFSSLKTLMLDVWLMQKGGPRFKVEDCDLCECLDEETLKDFFGARKGPAYAQPNDALSVLYLAALQTAFHDNGHGDK
ncbi:MAG: hypothetical protein M1822_008270 [Bathelium mastoideum]|nr:MAG: hypothetical protein M1822_008270 [Bathelium mastoideum]